MVFEDALDGLSNFLYLRGYSFSHAQLYHSQHRSTLPVTVARVGYRTRPHRRAAKRATVFRNRSNIPARINGSSELKLVDASTSAQHKRSTLTQQLLGAIHHPLWFAARGESHSSQPYRATANGFIMGDTCSHAQPVALTCRLPAPA
jgi:hypothetical protein